MSSSSQKKMSSPSQKRKRSSPTNRSGDQNKPLKKRTRQNSPYSSPSSKKSPIALSRANLETTRPRISPTKPKTKSPSKPNSKTVLTKTLSPFNQSFDSTYNSKKFSPKKSPMHKSSPQKNSPKFTLRSDRVYLSGNQSDYSLIRTLGEGNFGAVWLAVDEKTGHQVAIKVFKYKPSKLPTALPEKTDFDREVFFGQALKKNKKCNSFVVCLLDEGTLFNPLISSNLDNFLVYELMDGDLEKYRFGSLHELLQCMVDTSKGLEWMHERMLGHGDIKPANLLFKRNVSMTSILGTINRTVFKIGDIGGACSINFDEPNYEKYQGVVSFGCKNLGTPYFTAPEILTHFRHRNTYLNIQKADIWSLGVTFFFLVQKFFFPNKFPEKIEELLPYYRRRFEEVPYSQVVLNSNVFYKNRKLEPLAEEDLTRLQLHFTETERVVSKVINKMIQVNPEKRMPLSQVISEIESYFSQMALRETSNRAEDFLM